MSIHSNRMTTPGTLQGTQNVELSSILARINAVLAMEAVDTVAENATALLMKHGESALSSITLPKGEVVEALRVAVREAVGTVLKSSGFDALEHWHATASPSFSMLELIEALVEVPVRLPEAVSLPTAAQQFWDKNSGIDVHDFDLAQVSARNFAETVSMEATALDSRQVAQKLKLSESTIRHYRSDRKLYAVPVRGKLAFPAWQFNERGNIPHLEDVLRAMPDDVHPQTVSGFFQTPQDSLVRGGKPTTPKDWLESDGPVQPVVALASELAVSI